MAGTNVACSSVSQQSDSATICPSRWSTTASGTAVPSPRIASGMPGRYGKGNCATVPQTRPAAKPQIPPAVGRTTEYDLTAMAEPVMPTDPKRPNLLLRLAAEGVVPVLGGCAGALTAGPVGGLAGIVVAQ